MPPRVPVLDHLDKVALVDNGAQLGQGLKKEVTFQNKIALRQKILALMTNLDTFTVTQLFAFTLEAFAKQSKQEVAMGLVLLVLFH